MRLLQRVKNILFKPRLEWDLIAAEKNSFRSLFTGYVLPLALPGAVAAMIGWTAFGVDSVFVTMKGIRWGIYHALDILFSFTLTIVVASLVIDLLAPYFGSEKI